MANAPLVDTCSKNATITYGCYKKLLTSIVDEQTPERAVTLVKQQYYSVPYVKSQCHQLVHVIGRAAYAKYGNIGEAFAHGDQFCWSGYYHGILEQLAIERGDDYIVKNANSICVPVAKPKYSFYHYNCVHGLGHGFMEAEGGQLFKALADCNLLKDNWEADSCYGGVFMQNIMYVQSPDEDANHSSAYLKADQPMYPCTAVKVDYKQQCYLMQTSYALQTVNYDFNKVFAMCSAVSGGFKYTCYQSLGRDASGTTVSDPVKTKALCALAPDFDAQKYCIRGAASDFVSYYHSDIQAKQLCNSLDSADLRNYCLGVVKDYYATF